MDDFFCLHKTGFDVLCTWLQEWKDRKQYICGQQLRIFFHFISVHRMDLAKDVAQLMSTRFQLGSYWIGWSKKNICSRVECVLARWIWEHGCLMLCCNLGEVRPMCLLSHYRQCCYVGKQVVHPYWLLTGVVWWCRRCKV